MTKGPDKPKNIDKLTTRAIDDETRLVPGNLALISRTISGRTVDVLNQEQKRKALLFEFYDKVNISDIVFRESINLQSASEGLHENYEHQRLHMAVRYVRYLLQLGGNARECAKLLALWRGNVNTEGVTAMMPYAELIVMNDGNISDLQLVSLLSQIVIPVSQSGAKWKNKDFATHSKDQVDVSRRGRALLNNTHRALLDRVYTRIHDFAPNHEENLIDPAGMFERSIDELSSLYVASGYFGPTEMRILSMNIAAVILKMCGSAFVNFVSDADVMDIVLIIQAGGNKKPLEMKLKEIFTRK